MTTVINPLHPKEKPLTKEAAERVTEAMEARRGAKVAARSGNPAKRIPARKMLKDRVFSTYIRAVYVREMDA